MATQEDDTVNGYGTVQSKEYGDFEKSVGLPLGFAGHLMQEDGWSFIIKLHALIEAALTRALVNHFHADTTLAEHLRRLNTGGGSGKVALARGAGLVSPPMVKFLEGLGVRRNNLVHGIENVGFNLEAYVQSLDADELSKLTKQIAAAMGRDNIGDVLIDSPKTAFLWAAQAVLEKLVGTRHP